MSWYYAGPEARPVGPISLEDVHARRASGQVTGETYVIEHTGQPGGIGSWRRYREIFPQGVVVSSLPPLPVAASPIFPPPMPAPVPAPNPLFPSAAAGGAPPPQPVYTPTTAPYVPNVAPHAAPHGHYPVRLTNACCAWGLGLGVGGFILSFVCGIGMLLDLPALLLCVIGFAQVQQRREQSGRGLAIGGAVLALLGLLVCVGWMSWLVPNGMKYYQNSSQQNSE